MPFNTGVFIPPNASAPAPSGPSMGMAALSAFLPAIAGLAPAGSMWGPVLSGISSGVGALTNYQSAQQAAQFANQQRQSALQAIQNTPVPQVGRPREFDQALASAKLRPIGEMVNFSTAANESMNRKVSDTRARFAQSGYDIAPEQLESAVEEQVRQGTAGRDNTLMAMLDRARQSYLNTLMGVGGAELQRGSTNAAAQAGTLDKLISVLLSPIDSAQFDQSSISNAVTNAQQLQMQAQQLRMQQKALDQQFLGGLIGGGMSLGGSLGGAGILAGGLSGSGGGLRDVTGGLYPNGFMGPV